VAIRFHLHCSLRQFGYGTGQGKMRSPAANECNRDFSPITKGDVQAGDGLSFLTLLGEPK